MLQVTTGNSETCLRLFQGLSDCTRLGQQSLGRCWCKRGCKTFGRAFLPPRVAPGRECWNFSATMRELKTSLYFLLFMFRFMQDYNEVGPDSEDSLMKAVKE